MTIVAGNARDFHSGRTARNIEAILKLEKDSQRELSSTHRTLAEEEAIAILRLLRSMAEHLDIEEKSTPFTEESSKETSVENIARHLKARESDAEAGTPIAPQHRRRLRARVKASPRAGLRLPSLNRCHVRHRRPRHHPLGPNPGQTLKNAAVVDLGTIVKF